MSSFIEVKYPSEYFKATLSAREHITNVEPNMASLDGVNPLTHLIAQGNEAEIKFLARNHHAKLVKAIEEIDALSLKTTNGIFKILHDALHRAKDGYTMQAFEHSFASISGVSATHYIARVVKDKTKEEIKSELTGLGFYNFAKSVSWTENSLVLNDKGEFSSGNSYLLACIHFFREHETNFFYKSPNGLTVFHELATSDKNLGKIAALTRLFNINLTKCVNDFNETVLTVAIVNKNKKIVKWFFDRYGDDVINDAYCEPTDNCISYNSACYLIMNAHLLGPHVQEWVDCIDESDLEDPKKSCLNFYRSGSKFNLKKMKLMADDLLEEDSKIKDKGSYIDFNTIIKNNEKDSAPTPTASK